MRDATPTLAFVFREWRFLLFGALVMFWTSPGQTYLISLFADEIRSDFGLGHGDLGSIYTGATLVSAAILWPAGRLVDKLPLTNFVWWVCAAMALGATAFSLVSGPLSLFFGILVVRFLGQGMMSHIAITAMARRYVAERGRAIAIAGFGFPIAEGMLPPLITIGLTLTHWQNIWIALGIAVAATLLPSIPFLLKRTAGQDGQGAEGLVRPDPNRRQWTRSEMVRDKRFFMIAPLVMTMSAIFTGLIFHQKFIIGTAKGWDFLWWSICFVSFAACQVAGSFIAGWLVDRVSARRIAPYVLMPFAVSVALLGLGENQSWAVIILGAMGMSAGATNPTYSSLWAELYGTEHLGAIRAAGAVLGVFASALGPVVVGWALDEGVSIITLTSISVLIIFAASALAAVAVRKA
jgi:MFS family permease